MDARAMQETGTPVHIEIGPLETWHEAAGDSCAHQRARYQMKSADVWLCTTRMEMTGAHLHLPVNCHQYMMEMDGSMLRCSCILIADTLLVHREIDVIVQERWICRHKTNWAPDFGGNGSLASFQIGDCARQLYVSCLNCNGRLQLCTVQSDEAQSCLVNPSIAREAYATIPPNEAFKQYY
jgi:hypothetical protein